MAVSKKRKTTKSKSKRRIHYNEPTPRMMRTQMMNWDEDYFTYFLVTDGSGEPAISTYDSELATFIQLVTVGSLVHYYHVCKHTYDIIKKATFITSGTMELIPIMDSIDGGASYLANPKITLFEHLIRANAMEYPYFPIFHLQAKQLGLEFGKAADTMISKEIPEVMEILDLIKDDHREWYDFFVEELQYTRCTDVDLDYDPSPGKHPVRERYFQDTRDDPEVFRALSTHFILVDEDGNVEFVTPETTSGARIVNGEIEIINKDEWIVPDHVVQYYRIHAGCSPVGASMRGINIHAYDTAK